MVVGSSDRSFKAFKRVRSFPVVLCPAVGLVGVLCRVVAHQRSPDLDRFVFAPQGPQDLGSGIEGVVAEHFGRRIDRNLRNLERFIELPDLQQRPREGVGQRPARFDGVEFFESDYGLGPSLDWT